MKKSEYENLVANNELPVVIEQLEQAVDEEYEENTMFWLTQCYLKADDERKARKIAKKYRTLFPAGEYVDQISEMLDSGNTSAVLQTPAGNERTAEMVRERSQSDAISTDGIKKTFNADKVADTKEGLSELVRSLDGEKNNGASKREIPNKVEDYFTRVVGMESVKRELAGFYELLCLDAERRRKSFRGTLIDKKLNFLISGARGSGKTMLSGIVARMLQNFGVVGQSLVTKYRAKDVLNPNVTSTIRFEVERGVIVIENLDDFFNINADYEGSFKRIVNCLLDGINALPCGCSVIVTGSSEAIHKLLSLNDDFDSLFYKELEISRYSSRELLEIMKNLAAEMALRIDPAAEKALLRKLNKESKGGSFMNAITLEKYLKDASERLALRYADKKFKLFSSDAAVALLLPSDFDVVPEEEESLEDLLNELDGLVGLAGVKKEIRKRVEFILTEQEANRVGSERSADQGTLHMMFTGNPGTGKTTIATLLGKIYQKLGILSNGSQVVTVSRADLVGQWQGHTAVRVRDKFKEAMGGILFIDEAYSLVHGDRDDFGHETVNMMMTEMENNRSDLVVILAGYSKEMAEFMKSNSGFKSRISKTIEFEDYTPEEMTVIFQGMVKKDKRTLEAGCEQALFNMIEEKSKVPDFGNARGVRNVYNAVCEEANSRLLKLKALGRELTKNEFDMITKEDILAVAETKSLGEKSLQELLDELDSLTGLKGVKQKVREIVNSVRINKLRQDRGEELPESRGTLHLVFKGNAGTGKTTVARLLGQIYLKLGVLKKNVFVEANRDRLVGKYSGHTAAKVNELCDEADGGILFIDEAYSLVKSENDDFGREAVEALLARIENSRDSLMVILAGYGKEMDNFLDTNQGLQSRLSNEIYFEEYSDDELLSIFKHIAAQKKMVLESGIEDEVMELIVDERSRVKDFGNARGVRNIVDKLALVRDTRLAALLDSGADIKSIDLNLTTEEDVISLLGKRSQGEKTLQELLDELNSMTGLSGVKRQIQEIVDGIEARKLREELEADETDSSQTLHLVFMGNAGTGKTTVARLLTKIYCKLGVLKRYTFVEAKREDLIGSYQGQTAPKVVELCKRADGGILFIDEAYSLVLDEHDSFGKEAVSTLIAEIENHRDRLMVILAGYGKDMDRFLATNQGLTSRLSNTIYFEDYSDDELVSIFKNMVAAKKYRLEDGLDDAVRKLIVSEKAASGDFGNARGCRNLVDGAIKRQNSRIVAMNRSGKKPSREEVVTITGEDLIRK